MMIKKILVALDYSDTCDSVLDQAIALTQATQASLNILNVLAPVMDNSITYSPYSDQDWAAYVQQYRETETARFNRLKSSADKAKAVGIKTELTQEIGSPGRAICTLAKSWDSDLIIVGSHGRKGLSEMLLGSVSNYVMHHAPCSVLVVHDRN
ncbi:MAG: universal stress protein [Cyanobacteria bacterium P01_F01_bin.150]